MNPTSQPTLTKSEARVPGHPLPRPRGDEAQVPLAVQVIENPIDLNNSGSVNQERNILQQIRPLTQQNPNTVIQINNTNIFFSGGPSGPNVMGGVNSVPQSYSSFPINTQEDRPQQSNISALSRRREYQTSLSTTKTKSSESNGESPERIRDSNELLRIIQQQMAKEGYVTISGKKYKISEHLNPEISFQSAISHVEPEPAIQEEEKESDTRSPHFSSFFTSPRDLDKNRKTGCFAALNVGQEKASSGSKNEEAEYDKVNFANMFSQLLQNTATKESSSIEKLEAKVSCSSIMDLVDPLEPQRDDKFDESTLEPAEDHQNSYFEGLLYQPDMVPQYSRSYSTTLVRGQESMMSRDMRYSVNSLRMPYFPLQKCSEEQKRAINRIAQIQRELPKLYEKLPPVMRQYTGVSSRSQNSFLSFVMSSPHHNNSQYSMMRPTSISELSAGSALSRNNTRPILSPKELPPAQMESLLSSPITGSLSQPNLHQNHTKIDLAFLFSSPLVMNLTTRSGEVKMSPMPAIDYETQFTQILDKLHETGNAVRYRKLVSTVQNFRMVMTEQPIALHFSGHGIENNERFFPDHEAKGQGNFLVFEHGNGDANFVSEQRLTKLIQASRTKLEFVFVASCYSQFAGEIFLRAGAKHVVCVRRGEQISDTAVSKFSRAFYHGIFSNHMNVCQAFAAAKHTVLGEEEGEAGVNEGNKFRLLKNEDECQDFTRNLLLMDCEEHCLPLPVPDKGEMRQISRNEVISKMKGKVDDFLGRSVEMHQLICYLHDHRLVTIKGVPGIGKTSLAKQVGYFLQERFTFKNGIIYLSVRGLNGVESAISQIHISLFKKAAPHDQMLAMIIKFLEDKEVLFIIDNVEDILQRDQQGFRKMIGQILQSCGRTRCLLTSRCSLGAVAQITEKVMSLKQLSRTDTATLLFRKSPRPITEKEVESLLSAHLEQANTEGKKGKGLMSIINREPARRLGEHPIIYLLGGHPQAISLAAPLLQQHDLLDFFQILNSTKFFQELHTGLGGPDNSLYSLQASLDLSLQYLKQKDPHCIQLFYQLGLMPGGVSKRELEQIWKDIPWQGQISSLMRASLLVKRVFTLNQSTQWTLLPFMTRYAQSKLSQIDEKLRHDKILQYYTHLCKKCYNQIGKKEQQLKEKDMNKTSLVLMESETNIWACLNRELEIGAGYFAKKMTFFQMYYEHYDQMDEEGVMTQRRSINAQERAIEKERDQEEQSEYSARSSLEEDSEDDFHKKSATISSQVSQMEQVKQEENDEEIQSPYFAPKIFEEEESDQTIHLESIQLEGGILEQNTEKNPIDSRLQARIKGAQRYSPIKQPQFKSPPKVTNFDNSSGNITPTHANALTYDDAPNLLSEYAAPVPKEVNQFSQLQKKAKTHTYRQKRPDLIESTSKTSLILDKQPTSSKQDVIRKNSNGFSHHQPQILPNVDILEMFLDPRLLISTNNILVRSSSHQHQIRKKKFGTESHSEQSDSECEQPPQELNQEIPRKSRKLRKFTEDFPEPHQRKNRKYNTVNFPYSDITNRSKSLKVERCMRVGLLSQQFPSPPLNVVAQKSMINEESTREFHRSNESNIVSSKTNSPDSARQQSPPETVQGQPPKQLEKSTNLEMNYCDNDDNSPEGSVQAVEQEKVVQVSVMNQGNGSFKREPKREVSQRKKELKSGALTNAEEDEISEESNEESQTSNEEDLEGQEKGYYGRSDLSSGEDEVLQSDQDTPQARHVTIQGSGSNQTSQTFSKKSILLTAGQHQKKDRRVSFRQGHINLKNYNSNLIDSENSSEYSFCPNRLKKGLKQGYSESSSRAENSVTIASDLGNSDLSSMGEEEVQEQEEEQEDEDIPSLPKTPTQKRENFIPNELPQEARRAPSKSYNAVSIKTSSKIVSSHTNNREKSRSTFTRGENSLKPNFQQFSNLGQLCVYYASNLVLQQFSKDALRVIEIGLNVQEVICRANLIKLRGLVKMESRNFKDAKSDFQEAYDYFQKGNSIHGSALCRAALGYLYLHKLENGEQQKKAKRYLEEALEKFEKEDHFAGQAYCYYHLSTIFKSDASKVKEYERNQKALQRKATKTNFIQRWQGRQMSLIIEVASSRKEQSIPRHKFRTAQRKPSKGEKKITHKKKNKPEVTVVTRKDEILSSHKLRAKKIETIYRTKARVKKEMADQSFRKRDNSSPNEKKLLQTSISRDHKEDLKKTKAIHYPQILGTGHDTQFKGGFIETPQKVIMGSELSSSQQGSRRVQKKSPVKQKYSKTGEFSKLVAEHEISKFKITAAVGSTKEERAISAYKKMKEAQTDKIIESKPASKVTTQKIKKKTGATKKPKEMLSSTLKSSSGK